MPPTAKDAARIQRADLARMPYGSDASDVVGVVRGDGGVILTGALTRDQVEAVNRELDPAMDSVEKVFGAGEENYLAAFLGSRTRRLQHCVKHSKTYREDYVCQEILAEYVAAFLGGRPGSHSLFASQGIEIMPGEKAQELHRDGRGFLERLGITRAEIVVNTLLALTDVTEEIGATRVIPGSHRWDDLSRPGSQGQTIPVILNAGDILLYSGNMLHGGGANVTSDRARRVIATTWSLSFLLSEEAWPFVFSVDEVRGFPPLLQAYLGFHSMTYCGEEPGFLWRVDNRPLQDVLDLTRDF